MLATCLCGSEVSLDVYETSCGMMFQVACTNADCHEGTAPFSTPKEAEEAWNGYVLDTLEEAYEEKESRKKKETSMRVENYTLEYCPFCEQEVAIRSKGVTACPECGKPLVPCSLCSDGTKQLYKCSECPHAHVICSAEDEFIPITNPPMTEEEIAFALAN